MLLAAVLPPVPVSSALAPSVMAAVTAAAAFAAVREFGNKSDAMVTEAAAEGTPGDLSDWRPATIATLVPLAVALATPGGTAFAAGFPLLLWFRVWSHASEVPPLPGAVEWFTAAAVALTICAMEGGLLHLDTGSQSGALLCYCASLTLAVTAARLLPSSRVLCEPSQKEDEHCSQPEIKELKRAALSSRKSWDARLQWRLRRKREQESDE